MSLDPISAGFDFASALIKRIFPDKDAQVQAQAKLNELKISGELEQISNQYTVITTEAKSEHTITSTWRPITMLTFVFIIANNYIIYPYLSLFWPHAPHLVLPPDMWALLKIGLGGYVIGRSGEKIATAIKNPSLTGS